MREIFIAFLLLPLSTILCIIWMEWQFQKMMKFEYGEHKKKHTKKKGKETN